MASLYNANLKPLGPGVKTHAYDHATKLFVADNLRLAPKQSFLFYVVLNVNQSIGNTLYSMFGGSTSNPSSQSLNEQYEAGLMVKRIDLPKFTINTKTYNAYNRKNIVTNTIQYDAITVTFHDDAADVVTRFWNDYYTYYFRDSDYDPTLYGVPHKYQNRQRTKWGFTPINRQLTPFLRDIQIFSLHNKRFTEYKLINPFITSWRHGEHDANGSNETMINTMTVNYETVKYRTGTVNPVDVNGFAVLHYDNFNSPISDSVTNIYSNAGIIGAIGTAGSQDLARPDGQGSGRGIFSSMLQAYNLYNTIKSSNFKALAGTTVGQLGAQAINGALNGSISGGISVPTLNAAPGYGTATTAVGVNPSTAAFPFASSVTTAVGTAAVISTAGAATNVGAAAAVGQAQALVGRGVETLTNPASAIVAQNVTQVAGFGQPNIPINPYTGQPTIGANQLLVVDDRGNLIPAQLTQSSVGSAYDPNNPALNSNLVRVFSDGNSVVSLREYTDGTRVATDQNGTVLYSIPKGNQAYTTDDYAAINNAALRNLNYNVETSTRFVTNPQTGVVTAVGGTTAQVSNTITQGFAGVTGVIAGAKVYEALAKTGLGKSVFGQIFATSLSAATGSAIYKATNNLLQPIINKGVGAIGQTFDNATQSIRNSVGQWSGTGGLNINLPRDNILSQEPQVDGSIVINMKDGSQFIRDPITGTNTKTRDAAIVPDEYYAARNGDGAASTAQPGSQTLDNNLNAYNAVNGFEERSINYSNDSAYLGS